MVDGDLRLDLQALGFDLDLLGYDSGVPALMRRARALFATVIDRAPGAIRVQTIHSFCQTLLASFPLEAQIMPGFRAPEAGEAAELQRQVMAQPLAEAGPAGDAVTGPARSALQRVGARRVHRVGNVCGRNVHKKTQ